MVAAGFSLRGAPYGALLRGEDRKNGKTPEKLYECKASGTVEKVFLECESLSERNPHAKLVPQSAGRTFIRINRDKLRSRLAGLLRFFEI
jgi:hypothetical protein